MARFGDVGPYSPENVYCTTQSGNIKDFPPSRRAQAIVKRGPPMTWKGIRGDAHPKSRAVITPDGRFGSAALAAEHFGITRQAIAGRANKRLAGWRWEQP
jgi:hypothetical protein